MVFELTDADLEETVDVLSDYEPSPFTPQPEPVVQPTSGNLHSCYLCGMGFQQSGPWGVKTIKTSRPYLLSIHQACYITFVTRA